MMRIHSLLILLCITCSSGCAAAQLRPDQDQLRQTLLDLYTTQIFDNLVRASNGMPIIQIDYTNATTTLTMKQTASIGNDYTDTHTNVASAMASMTHTFTNVLKVGLGLERTNQAAVTGSPVIASNEVYDAYLAFLGVQGSLQCTCDPPPACAAHMCRKYGKVYYWIPIQYKRLFLELSLITTAQRGKALLPPNQYFTATIIGRVLPDCEQMNDSGQTSSLGEVTEAPAVTRFTVELDKTIPNDNGRVVITIRGTDGKDVEVTLPVAAYSPGGVFSPTLTKCIDIAFNPALFKDKKNISIESLDDLQFPLQAKFYLDQYRPEADKTSDLLDRVNFNLQQIQFNQLRSSSGF